MSDQKMRALIAATSGAIAAHRDELSELDRAIGDGDHGHNMARGFAAIADAGDEIAGLSFGKALQKAGMTLVMKVGGASGPLFGSGLMAMGKARDDPPASLGDLLDAFEAGIAAVKQRGKSDVGAKTMLDVLAPVARALRSDAADPVATARRAADESLEATRDMRATKGRAAFLGERSIGHIDPGARSCALLIHAVCDVIEKP